MLFTITYYDVEKDLTYCHVAHADSVAQVVADTLASCDNPNDCKITGIFKGELCNIDPGRPDAAPYPSGDKDMTGPWHAASCSLYEAPASHVPKPDIQFEALGSIHVVQPLTKRGMNWVRHKLAFEQWQVVGGTGIAVEARTVDDLRQNAVDDGLVVK